MESVARDTQGEVGGPDTADLERGVEKLEPVVEVTYKRKKHMWRQAQPRQRRKCLRLMHLM